MYHKIQKFDNKLPILDENRKKIGESQGYSFLDEKGNCILIVYGEGRRDFMSQYLTNPGDKLEIKYYYINL